MRCRCCNCWMAPEWLIRAVEYAVIIAAVGMGAWLATGCSTRTMHISHDGNVTISQTALGYCPEAVLIRASDVEMMSDASGVGATLRSLGDNAVEVMKP